MLDLVVHFVDVLRVERWNAHGEFVQENTQTPPIHSLAVADTGYYLGGQILGSAAEGVCLVVRSDVLGQPEIG